MIIATGVVPECHRSRADRRGKPANVAEPSMSSATSDATVEAAMNPVRFNPTEPISTAISRRRTAGGRWCWRPFRECTAWPETYHPAMDSLHMAIDLLADRRRIPCCSPGRGSPPNRASPTQGTRRGLDESRPREFTIDRYMANPETRRRSWAMRAGVRRPRRPAEPGASSHRRPVESERMLGCVTQTSMASTRRQGSPTRRCRVARQRPPDRVRGLPGPATDPGGDGSGGPLARVTRPVAGAAAS